MAVFQKNGTWWIDFYHQGKRIRRKVGPSKRMAAGELRGRRAGLRPPSGRPPVAAHGRSPYGVGKLADQWKRATVP